jgi:hypothetical protein
VSALQKNAAAAAEPDLPPLATLFYRLEASTGYEAKATYNNVTPDQYRQVVAALNGTLREETDERAAHVAGLINAAKDAFEFIDAQFRFRDLAVRDNLRAAIAQVGGWEILATPAPTSAHPDKRPCFAMQREIQEGGAA